MMKLRHNVELSIQFRACLMDNQLGGVCQCNK